ncbi:Fc.00g025640.m01.CDS01 [Cosmosporella sp. VM-42]
MTSQKPPRSSRSPLMAASIDADDEALSHDMRDDEDREAEQVVPLANARAHLQSLEANSGAAFVGKLALKLDPGNAPQLRLFAWNTGERLAGCLPGTPRPITSILSQTGMISLARVYFEKVAVAYEFIDRDDFFTRLDKRWTNQTAIESYDQVLCGVAALGLHFSEPSPPSFEPDLVESARNLLEHGSLSTPPSIHTVTGWVLRVAYLRMTSLPHTTWLASCSLMHVAEAAKIHQEAPQRIIFDESQEAIDLDIRRRLWGMAQHLNIWVSFDLGRTKITLPTASTKPVTKKPDNVTSQLLGMIPLTESLDPNKTRSVQDLESDLARLLDEVHEEPPVVMAQINLLLCLYRRLRAQKSNMINRHMNRILELATKGLRAAQRMVAQASPWHHAANIPFQVVCLLLAIDNQPSLPLLHDALSVLRQVRDTWNSAAMREAYDTAYLFIFLHQRRKEEHARALRDILSIHSVTPSRADNDSLGINVTNSNNMNLSQPMGDSTQVLGLDDLITDMPSLREFDLEQFLVQDSMQPQSLGDPDGGIFGTGLL